MEWGSALGSIGSSIIGAGMSIYTTNSANKHAKRQAEQQRAWEERMSNTAHQREMADLRAAGINPLLTATGGNGATTPNSAAAQTFAAQVNGSDFSNSMIGSTNAETNRKEQEQGRDLIDSVIDKNKTDVDNDTRDSLEYQKTQEKERELLDAQIKSQNLTNKVNSATAGTQVKKTNAQNITDTIKTRMSQHPIMLLGDAIGTLATSALGVKNLVKASRVPSDVSTTSESFDARGNRVNYTEKRTRKR